MIYIDIFVAFFIPGILGYGGGPASIPLIENEVVLRYGWMSVQVFSAWKLFTRSNCNEDGRVHRL